MISFGIESHAQEGESLAASPDTAAVAWADSLEGAFVKARFIRRRGADMIVSVKNNPDAEGRNALQFLGRIPGVSGLSIYGKDAAKVYVNGRELKMDPETLRRYLAGLSAEDLRSVQVKPGKGAATDGSHRGGAIMLQMRTGGSAMTSGNLAADAGVHTCDGSLSANASASVNHTDGKFSSYTFFNPYWLANERKETAYTIDDAAQTSVTDRGFYVFNLDQSFVYDVSQKHRLGLALNAMVKPSENSRTVNRTIDAENLLSSRASLYSGSGALNWQFNHDDRGSYVKASADYLARHDGYGEDNIVRGDLEISTSATLKQSWALKAEQSYVFGDYITELTAGAFWQGMDASQSYGQAVRSDRFLWREHIFGAYAEVYTCLFDDLLDFTAGLRYEGARVAYSYSHPTQNRGDGSDSNDKLFPSVSLTFNAPSGKCYTSLSYDRSISRPYMSLYDPVVWRDGDNIYTVGATHISPSMQNSVSLVQGIGERTVLTISYDWENALWDERYRREGDAIYCVYEDVGSTWDLALYGSTSFWIAKNRLWFTGSGRCALNSYHHVDYGSVMSVSGYVSASLYLYLPKYWSLWANGTWNSAFRTATYRTGGFYNVDFGIQKKFRHDISLKLYTSQLMHSRWVKTESMQEDVAYSLDLGTRFRSVNVALSWRFGNRSLDGVRRASRDLGLSERTAGR